MHERTKSKAKIELIKKLNLYIPTTLNIDESEKIFFSLSGRKHSYFKITPQDFFCDFYYHFPVIVDPDGSLWTEASRYILSRLNSFTLAKPRTLESIATDLAHFRNWLLDEDIDFLKINKRPRARPTYRYVAFLHGEVQLGKGKASTAKRRVSSIQNFYRWLSKDGIQFNYPLWLESDSNVNFNDQQGFRHSKKVITTDLSRSFKTPKNPDEYSEYINDGGKLRPLSKKEQIAIVEALKQISNIEMLLSFLLALTTGARLQTVFTFRQQQFKQELSKNTTYHRIKVGSTTLVNTKNNKQIVLHIPSWLYRRIQVYLHSERYNNRVHLSKHIYKHEDEQYAFLTRTGRPYYMASNDDFVFLYHSPPRGNAITQFIRQQLKPKLKKNGQEFKFRFHDLRASFGMNLLEEKLTDYPQQGEPVTNTNKPDFFQMLMYVKTRMGHSQIRTTEAYLNYRQKYKIALHIQSEFENYLKELICSSEGNNYDLG